MAWNLKGSYAETCSCELMCPCNLSFDHGATYDFCRATLAFHVREGEIDGTDVAGLNAVVIIDTPKVMTDGNWRLGMFIDERASDEQADKLAKVFGGQLGGPMAGLAPLVGEVLGVERARIELTDDGLRHGVRVGGRDRLRDRGHRALRRRDRRAGPVRRHVPPGRLRSHDGRGDSARGSTRSGSSTRARRGFRRPSSPGPRDRLGAGSVRRREAGAHGRTRRASVSSRLLAALAAVGWWSTAERMRGMDDGPWTALGTLGWFLGVWVVMMAAMMFPSLAPTVALYSRMTTDSAQRRCCSRAGYLVAWGAAGVGRVRHCAGRWRDRR